MPDPHEAVLSQVDRILHSALPVPEKLNGALRYLAKYRSALIQWTLIRTEGQKVLNGPFQGMMLASGSAEGCYVPKLLGCYEAELHPYVAEAAQRGYEAIINVGTAEGYYAIGMARLLPSSNCSIRSVSRGCTSSMSSSSSTTRPSANAPRSCRGGLPRRMRSPS